MNSDKCADTSQLAKQVLALARDTIVVRFRFFDRAIAAIKLEEVPESGVYRSAAGRLSYDPVRLLKDFADDENHAVRLLLHVIFHNIFMHHMREDIANPAYWNIACDIAAENAVLAAAGEYRRLGDAQMQIILAKLGKWVPQLSAEKLYREFMVGGISESSAKEYAKLFAMDIHDTLADDDKNREEIRIAAADWEQIARRVAAELRSFSKDVKGGETILLNLKEGVRRKYDYDDIVRRFAVMSEQIKVNPDEFDNIAYTYGLSLYKNMPIIEPLEYTDEKKIKEFVIAIDTSASVRGRLVEGFLVRTYDLLSESASFAETMNVHIIQCDSEITEDTKVTSREDLKAIADNLKVRGFGATDFRPVFDHVDEMIRSREFTDLKGLIYFTDGYGIYPENPPGYDCMFVFDNDDEFRPPVPGWAIKVVL
ncbi:MAG: hypothetical protein IKO16_04825 [Lachnospiraceae bacterium]|nr:hypothetical protein [Lachnospiraceae bacterium]